ncbi:MAG: HAD-IA family hydrolase [Naasia sp.]
MPALIFDCDGVLADTEQDGHLRAFNATFAEFGLPVRWSVEDYAHKVKIGGGKERMRSLLTADFVEKTGLPRDEDGQAAALADWHKRKTAIYTQLVDDGIMPARPGIKRIATEAADAGWTLVVCSTSAYPSVHSVLTHAVGAQLAERFTIFAGDVVPRKKPAPDIYLLALHELSLDADDVVVIEDSENGLRAALAAGLRTVVTVSSLTAEENFSGASLVVSSLGDRNGEPSVIISDPLDLGAEGYIGLECLDELRGLPRPIRSELQGA